MAVTPNSLVLGQGVNRAQAAATAANTSYQATPTVVLLMTAGTNGSIIRKLTAIPRATVTATQLQLFVYDGTNYWFIASSTMAAYTMAQTTTAPTTDFGYGDQTSTSGLNGTLYLPSGSSLYVGIGVALAAGIVFSAEYTNL